VILFICLSIVLALFYAVLMLYYAAGWQKLKTFTVPADFTPSTYVSVIIPARNEEENISAILRCIINQNYPKHLLDIVVVDDASTDNTAALVKQYANDGVRLIQQKLTDENNAYKKKAIDYAISQCNSTIIITTDADCRVSENWVRTIVAYQNKYKACFISSPVTMHPAHTVFQKFQALEFAGLVGIGAAALAQKHPNMCNGANVAYLKDAFNAVNGFKGNDNIPSGDDEFLMHKMFAAFPKEVLFLKSPDATVYTEPTRALKEFIHQRMRWVSKSTKYENKAITIILVLCYMFNLTLLINFAGMFFNQTMLYLFATQMLLKIIAEGFLLNEITKFMKIQKTMLWLIPEQLLHVVYIVVIGILGNTVQYNWKGRKV
jgi:cellulose synthase/poly-beta-1,6-N-acetylglucosamine synthase-like glycosyltransferase